jgi:hypothetical protein
LKTSSAVIFLILVATKVSFNQCYDEPLLSFSLQTVSNGSAVVYNPILPAAVNKPGVTIASISTEARKEQ